MLLIPNGHGTKNITYVNKTRNIYTVYEEASQLFKVKKLDCVSSGFKS
jgi:hypothetical protein